MRTLMIFLVSVALNGIRMELEEIKDALVTESVAIYKG